MADDETIGTDWTDAELDLIVADYFAMLQAEQAGWLLQQPPAAATLADL